MNLKNWLKRSARNDKLILASAIMLILTVSFLQPASAVQITEYPLATISNPDPRPRSIAVDDNKVWFTEQFADKIGLLRSSTIYEWNIPTAGSEPWDIVVDDQGDVWFTQYGIDRIALFKDNRYFIEFDLPTLGGYTDKKPMGMTIDPIKFGQFKNVWWTEFEGNAIGKIYYNSTGSPNRWIYTRYVIPGGDSRPMDIAVSPYNGFVWFTQWQKQQIGCFNPGTLTFKEYALFGGTIDGKSYRPENIGIDSSGFIWFTLELDASSYDMIARLNPWTAEITTYEIPTLDSAPADLVIDDDNNIWVTEFDKGKIVRLNPVTRYMTEYELPDPASYPLGITFGSSIHFTEWLGNKIGKLDLDKGKEYSTVNTITSATTKTTINPSTSTLAVQTTAIATIWSSTTAGATVATTSEATHSSSSTNKYATSSLTTYTETVLVNPTTTTITTTHSIVSTSTTRTTVSPTLTTYVSTTYTTTTTTPEATLSDPVATESTAVTRQEVFTDYISTTIKTEYAATSFKFKTTTVQFYTSWLTSTIWTTTTLYSTITKTITGYATVTSGGGIPSLILILAMVGLMLLKHMKDGSKRRKKA